jgi:hypothetical protein
MQINTLAATGLDWTSGPLIHQRFAVTVMLEQKIAHLPRSQAEFASMAPKSEYTIMPFQ